MSKNVLVQHDSKRQAAIAGRASGVVGLMLAAAALTGCNVDNFIDPSVVGRWEKTPTVVPVLERITSVEDVDEGFVEYTDVRAGDLVPEPIVFRIGPGDFLQVQVESIVVVGRPELYELRVDSQGTIEIPQLGRIRLSGLTPEQARQAIEQRVMEAGITRSPLVQLTVPSPRQATFNVFGAVAQPGPYALPEADYRLLEALSVAGGFSESTRHIFVIRQVPLQQDEFTAPPPAVVPMNDGGNNAGNEAGGEDFLDILDGLADPSGAVFASSQPASNDPMAGLAPAVDLVDPGQTGNGDANGRWVFVDGEWVRLRGGATASSADGSDAPVTQRVIRVPVEQLVDGNARFNIVIRPGDLIRVPAQDSGVVYVGGEVNRPGVYNIPITGPITLDRVITAAGGYSPIAVPDRIDLTRMVGPDRQAKLTLNGRAIAEGTMPDVYLKPDDHIRVGTDFWATPLAVVRNGFRFSYGFGFLLDRNFGNDAFGPPPTNVGNQ
ncbi:MAG: SLBB domain-containing protein [Planctomycetota bacterium]